MPNWRTSTEYDFIHNARPELIAWQFLRRNPEYRNDYHWFISLWNELESQYGVPPHRDFNSWKKDPRAYRSEREIYDQKHSSTTDDDLLIECWMGTKWGFYKFPVNPDNEKPALGSELTWRNNPISLKLITENSITDITALNLKNKVAIIFDLEKNLKEQIQNAKQQLIIAQKNNLKSSGNKQQWILCLRLLDAIEENGIEKKIQKTLNLTLDEYLNIKSLSEKFMRDHYLEIVDTV